MKKILVLLLVLCTASMASAVATLNWSQSSIDIVTGASAVVYITSDNAEFYTIREIGEYASTSVASITGIVKEAAAGNLGGYTEFTGTYAGWWGVFASSNLPTSDVGAGNQFAITITAGPTTGSVQLYSDGLGASTNSFLTVNVIPEPMTIALLGLGGLFLRRRK